MSTKFKSATKNLKSNLTPHQYKAAEKILKFIESERKFFLFKGFAGTGKTHVLANIIKVINNEYQIIVAAVIHAALENLNRKLKNQYNINVTTSTIASLLGTKPDYNHPDFLPEKPIYTNQMSKELEEFEGILIIDETSTLDEFSIKSLINGNFKIIFTGDFEQAPPIGKTQKDVEFLYENMESHELTEIIRTSKSDIADLSMNIRLGDHKSVFNYTSTENIKVVNYDDYKYDADIVLAFTNNNVNIWNSKSYINKFNTKKFAIKKGIKIVLYKNICCGYNSEMLVIDEICPNPTQASRIIDSIKAASIRVIEDKYIGMIEKLEEDYLSKLLVREVSFEDKESTIYIVNEESISTLIKLLSLYYELKEWKKIDILNSNILMMENLIGKSHNGFQRTLAMKNYGLAYAITIHKSQGATYSKVAIDVPNISEYCSGDIIKNILYTSVTRASDEIILLKKPKKF